MMNPFTFIGTAWNYYRSQPVLNEVMFWLLFVPGYLIFCLDVAQVTHPIFDEIASISSQASIATAIGIIILILALVVVAVWGMACVILVGKKLMQSRAGRARSSFATVAKQGYRYVWNIFFTSILRGCTTLLWSLLFVVPGIIYAIRTVFFEIAIVNEGKSFRGALKTSQDAVKGHTWQTLWQVLSTGLVIHIPYLVLLAIFELKIRILTPSVQYIAAAPLALVQSMSSVLYILTLVCIYNNLKQLPQQVKA